MGPAKSGKTYLATKLSEYLVVKSGEDLSKDCITLFPANKMTAQQCSDFVANIGKRDQPGGRLGPSVVILDNIHTQAANNLN